MCGRECVEPRTQRFSWDYAFSAVDLDFLVGPYFTDSGRVADAALDNRNRFIEWSFGIVTAILFGALVAQTVDIVAAWLAAAFAAAVVMPLFSIAVVQHGYFTRFNSIRRAILELRDSMDEKDRRTALQDYASHLVRLCDMQGRNLRTRFHVVRSVFLLGLGYLIIATQAALVWFSWAAFCHFQAEKPWGTESILVIIGVVAVYLVILREIHFLATTPLLRYAGFENREAWLRTTASVSSGK